MQSQAVKKIGMGLALVGLVALGLIVFTLSVINTGAVSNAIFPNDMVRSSLNIALYDFGMVVWVLVFLFLCESLAQYVVALTAFFINALAVFAINILSINLSQTLAAVDAATMGLYAVYLVESIMVWHLAMGLLHILAHPWVWSQIEQGVKRAEVITIAYNRSNALMDERAGELADEMAANIHRAAVAEIRGSGGGKARPEPKQLPAPKLEIKPVPMPVHGANGHGGNGSNPTSAG